ncbi:hypothetical protein ACTOV4_02615 [Brucella sp. C7-11G]
MRYENDYTQIASLIDAKTSVDFVADRVNTHFEHDAAPDDWTPYPPPILPPNELAEVYIGLSSSLRGRLSRHELNVQRDGGTILYKRNSDDADLVDIKVIF